MQVYKMLCIIGWLTHIVSISKAESEKHLVYKWNKQMQRIVVLRAAINLTLKKDKGQGHGMVPIERACHKDHAWKISMLSH